MHIIAFLGTWLFIALMWHLLMAVGPWLFGLVFVLAMTLTVRPVQLVVRMVRYHRTGQIRGGYVPWYVTRYYRRRGVQMARTPANDAGLDIL